MTDVWTYLKNTERPIIMYGTGDGADKILNVFEKYGIKIRDIFVSDEFFRPKTFRGFNLKRYSDIVNEYGDRDIVIILAFAVFRDDMLSRVKEIGKKYELLAPEVPVFGTDYFSSETIKAYRKDAEAVYSLLADETSRKVFEAVLNYRLTGKPEYLYSCETERSEVFSEIIKLSEHETYLDLGAYRGDTIEEFLDITSNKYEKILALEPDKKNFGKLSEYIAESCLSDVSLYNAASWSESCTVSFSGGGGRNSCIDEANETEVTALSIDELISRELSGVNITYVKMDVEGAEAETLTGMKKLLSDAKPKLAVSAYHKTEDLFKLPLMIKELNSDYKIYLRHHPYIPDWETNLYCI